MSSNEYRVLVYAPHGRDVNVISEVLGKAAILPEPCASIAGLAANLEQGAGAALIADESLDRASVQLLAEALHCQPPWSDFPLLIMTRARARRDTAQAVLTRVVSLGNVTLLERPLHVPTLVSGIHSALRARRHQYQARDRLEEQRRTSETLKESEARLQFALASARLGAWELDLESSELRCSVEFKRNFGLDAAEPLSYPRLLSLIHPQDLPRMRAAIQRAIDEGGVYEAEYRIILPDQTQRWIFATGRTILDSHGRAVRMAGTTMDISSRRAAEELIGASEEQLRTLADAMPQLVWMAQPDGAIFWYNRRWYDYTGLEPGASDGWDWQSAVDPEMLSSLVAEWKRCLAAVTPFQAEIRLRGVAGQCRWFLSRAVATLDSSGQVLRWFGTCTDIDDQKNSEVALRRSYRRLELLSGVATDLLRFNQPEELLASVFDRISSHSKVDLCLAYVSQGNSTRLAFSAGFPLPPEGRLQPIQPGQFLCREFHSLASSSRREAIRGEDETATLLRSLGAIDFYCCPLLSNGKAVGVLGFGTRHGSPFEAEDIEIQRTISDQVAVALDRILLLAELAASNAAFASSNAELARANTDLEQFAFSASHDLREPLRHISIYSEMLQRRAGAALDEESRQFLSFVIAGAHRMELLVRDLLAYTQVTHAVPANPSLVDSDSILRKVLGNLTQAIRETGAVIEMEPLPKLPIVEVHLVQLFQNLIENAIKYHTPGVPPRIRVYAQTSTGGSVRICVQDNGIGIEPKYSERIFGLFKRLHTCDKYEGTGIGLALCQKIVERYNGNVWVESQPGRGALFCFELPQDTHGSQYRTALANFSR